MKFKILVQQNSKHIIKRLCFFFQALSVTRLSSWCPALFDTIFFPNYCMLCFRTCRRSLPETHPSCLNTGIKPLKEDLTALPKVGFMSKEQTQNPSDQNGKYTSLATSRSSSLTDSANEKGTNLKNTNEPLMKATTNFPKECISVKQLQHPNPSIAIPRGSGTVELQRTLDCRPSTSDAHLLSFSECGVKSQSSCSSHSSHKGNKIDELADMEFFIRRNSNEILCDRSESESFWTGSAKVQDNSKCF